MIREPTGDDDSNQRKPRASGDDPRLADLNPADMR